MLAYKVEGNLALFEWALCRPGRFWIPTKAEATRVVQSALFLGQDMRMLADKEVLTVLDVRTLAGGATGV